MAVLAWREANYKNVLFCTCSCSNTYLFTKFTSPSPHTPAFIYQVKVQQFYFLHKCRMNCTKESHATVPLIDQNFSDYLMPCPAS